MPWNQYGSNIVGEAANDNVGCSIALSEDGNTIIVGAVLNYNSSGTRGHAVVYSLNNNSWVQKGNEIFPEVVSDANNCGFAVSISRNGLVIAVSDFLSRKTPIVNSPNKAGRVVVYYWNYSANAWSQQTYYLGTSANDNYGYAVSLNSDGTIIAISSIVGNGYVRVFNANSTNTGSGGKITNGTYRIGSSVSLSSDGLTLAIGGENSSDNTGVILIYKYTTPASAAAVLNITIIGGAANNFFGCSVSLSADASIVASGEYGYDNNTGRTRVFHLNYTNNTYTQIGLDLVGEAIIDEYGRSVSLNSDGTIVAVGARNNNQNKGKVYIYKWNQTSWNLIGFLPGVNNNDQFGYPISLSSTGYTVASTSYASNNNGFVKTYKYVVTPIFSFSLEPVAFGSNDITISNPNSDSPGAFQYSSSDENVASITGNTVRIIRAGTVTISATQLASNPYISRTINSELTVNQAVPTITFTIPSSTYGADDFLIPTPISNSTGEFQYSSLNPAVATIINGNIHIVGAGQADISATQLETTNYTSTTVVAKLSVNQAVPNFNFSIIPNTYTYGAANFTIPDPSSNSAGAFQYSSLNTNVATIINRNEVQIVGAGQADISATQIETTNYLSRTIIGNLTITQGVPTLTFTIPSQTYGADDFLIPTPISNSTGEFQYSSLNPAVATITVSYTHLTLPTKRIV